MSTKERIPNSDYYRSITQPVSLDDLKLGLHVGNSAVTDAFPMKPASDRKVSNQTVRQIDPQGQATDSLIARGLLSPTNEGGLSFSDDPFFKALFAMKDSQLPESVFTRLTALQLISPHRTMKKWVRRLGRGYEWADAVLEAATDFPFCAGTLDFKAKTFAKRVQQIADLRYGGKFT